MDALLPLIDLSAASDEALGRQIDAACRARGFFYIIGHGVDAALRQRMFHQAQALFALPTDAKERWHMARSPARRGYEGPGYQTLAPGTPPDLKESFYLGVDRGPNDPLVRTGTPNHGPNQWPDAALLPEFRATADAYFAAMDALARRLMGLMALGLGLPQDYFEAFTRDPMPVLRLLHYPPLASVATQATDARQMGAGAHTDWGSITLLAQDDVGGLELLGADGQWSAAPPVADSFVVNLGDMMARWANDRYRSTLHRVLNNASGRDRYSIPFFFDIDYHAEVKALPGCHDASNPPRHAPITAGGHIVEMYERTTGAADA